MDERNPDFDDFLDEVYEPYRMGDMTYYASDILFECDPIAYRVAVADWESETAGE